MIKQKAYLCLPEKNKVQPNIAVSSHPSYRIADATVMLSPAAIIYISCSRRRPLERKLIASTRKNKKGVSESARKLCGNKIGQRERKMVAMKAPFSLNSLLDK